MTYFNFLPIPSPIPADVTSGLRFDADLDRPLHPSLLGELVYADCSEVTGEIWQGFLVGWDEDYLYLTVPMGEDCGPVAATVIRVDRQSHPIVEPIRPDYF